MDITVGVGHGVPKDEARITYMNVDLLHNSMINLTYEVGVSVKTINISVHEAVEIGFLDFNKLDKFIK